MEMQATQDTGVSIHERLLSKLSDEPLQETEPEKETATEAVKEQESAETQEVEPEGDGVEQANEPLMTTAELAKYLGVDENLIDVDDDGTPLIKAKVDGQETKAKLKELVDSYQLRSHYDKRLYELSEQQKQIATHRENLERQALEKVQFAEDVINHNWNNLVKEYQAVDWERLRAQDPGEYAAQYADFQARQVQVQNTRHQLEIQRKQAQEAIQQQMYASAKQQEELEARKLDAFIPNWRAEKEELTKWAPKYLEKWGESPELLNGVTKGMVLDLLRTRMLYEKQQEQKSVVEQKVRIAPKLVKSGTASTPQENQSASIKSMKQVIKKSGGKDGLKEYLIATGRA